VLRLDRVSKAFADVPAVRELSLDIPESGTVALLGPSGCGKSTCLRLLLGLIQPDEGVVTFHGKPLEDHPQPGVRQRFGYVIQDGGLFPHMTARQNAMLPARHVRGSTRPRSRDLARRIDELARMVRLDPGQLDRFPSELSGGQRQRVALVRALVLDPEVLLLDEPLGALDPVIRGELQVELKRVFSELKKMVVLVTHDLAEAAFLADDIVLMNGGRVAQRGSFVDLTRDPADAFVRTFVTDQVERVRSLIAEVRA
jgi:osmoprotectant transport system ATP-binding protein